MGCFLGRSRASGKARLKVGVAYVLFLPMLSACSSLGGAGPTAKAIASAGRQSVANAQIQIIDVNDDVARRMLVASDAALFSQAFGDAPAIGTRVGRGDVLQVTIWEAPPAALFGANTTLASSGTSAVLASTEGVGQRTSLPDMMVDDDGRIRVPFAGPIQAAGRTPRDIEREITARLARKAHDPQVSVQISSNASANVTVVGEVEANKRVALTPKGERLLDVIAAAGGVKDPVGKVTIQVSRNGRVAYLPLQAVISDPAQNIRLGPDDVVTALYQPFSFIALGATNTSAEVPFEGTGLTLAQALGRAGGLRDDRANIRGAFIFRLEDPAAVDAAVAATARRTPDGRIPVIYRVDMGNPATFFVAQSFPIRNKDVLYVSSAPLSDFQRFFSIVSSMTFSVLGLSQSLPKL